MTLVTSEDKWQQLKYLVEQDNVESFQSLIEEKNDLDSLLVNLSINQIIAIDMKSFAQIAINSKCNKILKYLLKDNKDVCYIKFVTSSYF